MRFFQKIIISCSFMFYMVSHAFCAQTLYLSNDVDLTLDKIFNSLYNILPESDTIAYTKVPRGLILSVEEDVLFDDSGYKLKSSGVNTLNVIVSVLRMYENKCVIESHTDSVPPGNSIYKEAWELSIVRATAVADYIVKIGKINPDRIFALGYGEMMPFKENVSQKGFSDKRVDFVIFNSSEKFQR